MYKKMKQMGLYGNELADKIAVVTGAGRGIGKELARALAWLGAKVVIAEIMETGKEAENQILSEEGSAFYVKTDVSKEKSVKKLAEKIKKKLGKINILVNNATIVETGSIMSIPLNKWDRSWEVNVRSAVILIKTFLPDMIESKEGTIVNVISETGMPFAAPYSASKAALNSLTLSLAAELGEASGVHVFTFAPGMVDTPGIRNAAIKLAPFYRMTYEEFLKQSVNLGYTGLMPA